MGYPLAASWRAPDSRLWREYVQEALGESEADWREAPWSP